MTSSARIDTTAIKWIIDYKKNRDPTVHQNEQMTEIDHETLSWPLFAIKALIDANHYWHIVVIDEPEYVNRFLRQYKSQKLDNPLPECKVTIKAFKKEETQFFVYYDWDYRSPQITRERLRHNLC